MLTYFDCVDGVQRPIAECLEHCGNPNGRCLSLPTLHTIGQTRKWRGQPSTTMLLNPMRLEYLQIRKPYSIDPFDQAFALLGTRHHGKLEAVAKKIEGLESELKLQGEVSGILDLLEPIDGGDTYRLIDYKCFGNFAVAKQLDTSGNSDYEQRKLALQLNQYRILAAKLGFNIVELKVQITVRDGGTWTAKRNGITAKLMMLPVPILPDDEVQEYFLTKAFALTSALDKNILPEACPYDERWGGRRCKGFCPTAAWCPEGAATNRIPLRED